MQIFTLGPGSNPGTTSRGATIWPCALSLSLILVCASACGSEYTPPPTAPSSTAASPPLNIGAGNYLVTVTSDRATSRDGEAVCAGFPDALLTRNYAATITPSASGPASQFNVNVASIAFALGVAGDTIGFTIDGPAIVEALPGYGYLEITGAAPTDVPATSTSAAIAIPFSGSFAYCALKSPMSSGNNCFTTPADQKIAYAQCLSDHDLMVLTRR